MIASWTLDPRSPQSRQLDLVYFASVQLIMVRVHLRPLLLVLSLLLVSVLRAADPLESIRHLPATNPYRAALERLILLPDEDREALHQWIWPPEESQKTAALTTAQRQIARQIAAAVVAASASPSAGADDWPLALDPVEPDNPMKMKIPEIGRLREMSQIALKIADELPPSEAVETYAAVALLGRRGRAGATLVQQLTGVTIESMAQAGVARRLKDFSAADLNRIALAWDGLEPAPTLQESLQGERDVFFRHIVETIVLPGLKALLAENPESLGKSSLESLGTDDSPGKATSDTVTGFTRDLRLSALVDFGGGEHQITLENVATGVFFTLRKDRPTEGVELVSIDFPRHQALIRHGKREAVIDLRSKRIVERERAADRLSALLKELLSEKSAADKNAILKTWLAIVRQHPDGPEGYIRDVLAAYDRITAEQVAKGDQAAYPPPSDVADPESTPPTNTDPLLSMVMPNFLSVGRSFNRSATQTQMLQAAIHVRLESLGQSTGRPAPADLWAPDGAGFRLETTPDGGFLLRSAYESSAGKPTTYKFGAADAGTVR